MRDCAGVPELCNHAAAGSMDGIRDASPSADLLLRPQTWRISPAESFRANRCGLRDDQSGRSTLGVILRLQASGHMIVGVGTHPSERRHDDAVRKIEVSHSIGCEKRLIRHHMNPWMCEAVSTAVLFWSVFFDLSLARFNQRRSCPDSLDFPICCATRLF